MNTAGNRLSCTVDKAQSLDARRSAFYLHPGQIFASRKRHQVTTILGSCVAVCLWEPESRIGGINHFLLPTHDGASSAAGRFGDLATRDLIERLAALGCHRRELRAKIYGGACVLEAFQTRQDHLGRRNVAIAEECLQTAGIPLIDRDVGGTRGRKVIFHTDDGSVWIRPL